MFLNFDPCRKIYYYGLIRIDEKIIGSKDYRETLSKCFKMIRKYNGDINQFLGGLILGIFGLPIMDRDIET
ncbi:MAG: hypothetical protein LBO80_00835 [Treponema sp.]|jgi:hypothetical protein|nr:hypothetical protein [Treponema sp.]